MKLTGSGKKFKVDDKRFAIPGVKLTGECPSCKAPFDHDFGDSPYLAYPEANVPEAFTCWCEHCDHEWEVPILVRVTVELVDPTPAGT